MAKRGLAKPKGCVASGLYSEEVGFLGFAWIERVPRDPNYTLGFVKGILKGIYKGSIRELRNMP